jgi:hypothetical protein
MGTRCVEDDQENTPTIAHVPAGIVHQLPLSKGRLEKVPGISQERLPLYLGFFEFVPNIRRRGKALLGSMIELLVAPRNPG